MVNNTRFQSLCIYWIRVHEIAKEIEGMSGYRKLLSNQVVPPGVRSVCIGIFLFLMNNVGGNLPMLVEPLTHMLGLQTALYIAWPSCLALSKQYIFL